jgi:hypothetical protein
MTETGAMKVLNMMKDEGNFIHSEQIVGLILTPGGTFQSINQTLSGKDYFDGRMGDFGEKRGGSQRFVGYHGTLPMNVDSILRDGFSIHNGSATSFLGVGIYTTLSFDIAKEQRRGGEAAVLAVFVEDITSLSISALTSTDASFALNPLDLKGLKALLGSDIIISQYDDSIQVRIKYSVPEIFVVRVNETIEF